VGAAAVAPGVAERALARPVSRAGAAERRASGA
jgi:hypothetical protein